MRTLRTLQVATFLSLFSAQIALLISRYSESDVWSVLGIVGGALTVFFGIRTFMLARKERRENG